MVLDAVLQKKDMVLDAVSKTFVIRKKSRIQYSSDFGFRHKPLHSGASVQFGRWWRMMQRRPDLGQTPTDRANVSTFLNPTI